RRRHTRSLRDWSSDVCSSDLVEDLERIRHIVRDQLGAEMVVTTSPVPLHSTFTPLVVRVANTESKSRIRAAVSEFIDAHHDVHRSEERRVGKECRSQWAGEL